MNNNIIILILVQLLLFKWPTLVIIYYGNQNLMVLFSKRDKLQDLNINQSKIEVHDAYRKDEK